VNPLPNNLETLALVGDPKQAELVASTLRYAGVSTHQYWVEDHYSFAEQLARQPWDLVILALPGKDSHVPSCILRYPDTPFIALTSGRKGMSSEDLLELGVTDVATAKNPARLRHTIERALREAAMKREHRAIHQQNKDQDNLLRNLLNTSEEPVAFIHQGVHSFANPAWLRLFGLTDLDSAIETPLLDLVTRRNRIELRRILHDFQDGNIISAQLTVDLKKKDGDVARAGLSMSIARFDGEAVIQVRGKPRNKVSLRNHRFTHSDDTAKGSRSVEQNVEPTEAISSWADMARDLLADSSLHIAVRPLRQLHEDNLERFSLVPTLVPGQAGPQSLERFLADLRRLDLLHGLDRWLLYNAASALAKRCTQSANSRFYVALQGDTGDLPQLAKWLDGVIGKFKLPQKSLNLILDCGGLTKNAQLSRRSVSELKALRIEVGLSGLHLLTLDEANALASNDSSEFSNTLATDHTLGLELIEQLTVDFALLEQSLAGNSSDSPAADSREMALAREICDRVSITPLIEINPGTMPTAPSSIGESANDSRYQNQGNASRHSTVTALDLTLSLTP